MIRIIPILLLAFKIWMAVDAGRKRQPYYWFLIIFFVPFGDLVYFIAIKIDDFRHGRLSRLFKRPPSLETLRYNARTSPSVNNRLSLAGALSDAGFFAEATAEYESILESHPHEPDALLGLAGCLSSMDSKDEALKLLQRLMAVSPAHLDCTGWRAYAELHGELGRNDERLSTLRELVRKHPRAQHQVMLAEALLETGHREEARSILRIVIEDDAHAPSFSRRQNRLFIARANELQREFH